MPNASRFMILTLVLGAVACVSAATAHGQATQPAVPRVYDRLMDPAEHPDYHRRHVQPPTWDTFGNRTQFVALRAFPIEANRIVNYEQELDKYTRQHELCTVVWPAHPVIFTENLGELADELKRRDLFLFDIWGYVPGSGDAGAGPAGSWTQFHVPEGVFGMLEEKLGDHWLGMDIGEQDGRYIGGYAPGMYPISEDRVAQYLNFHRHFEYMGHELGNRLSTLVSLNFGHHLIKDGTYCTIGAETAQALPNNQVYYAFIRGAGKQYGVPWFGNASIFNRWGYKTYDSEGPNHSPVKGSSLSLLKRLMYSHILYNCVFVGFESQWFIGEALSPIGLIQLGAKSWLDQNGMPGTMLAPVAVMTDFFAGWSFPRHLYTGNVYRVWGNIPYGPGDYLTDNVLDMLYPGYQDASYFHDESGFMTATPYGDIADCLLTDAPEWLLRRYAVLVLTGEVAGTAELHDTLEAYVAQGGHLVITAGNLAQFSQGLAGVRTAGSSARMEAGAEIRFADGSSLAELAPFDLLDLSLDEHAEIVATCGQRPVVAEASWGKGRVTVLASPFGVPADPAPGPIANAVDQQFVTPYPMLRHVASTLNTAFVAQKLFDVGEGLGCVVCRKGPGEYTVGVFNNALEQRPFTITPRCGTITSIRELPIDASEKSAPGYLPEGYEKASVGSGAPDAIAGGDVRLFAVSLDEQGIETIVHETPPARPRGRILPLRDTTGIREAILRRPTFFQHFDGVSVDWRNLHHRDEAALRDEAAWLKRQDVRIFVDLTSGLNLFPDLRLVDNDAIEYGKSMAVIETVMRKMAILGATDLLLAPHRQPETNITAEENAAAIRKTIALLAQKAKENGITLYLRPGQTNSIQANHQTLTDVNAPNLKLAVPTARLVDAATPPDTIAPEVLRSIGLWLAGEPQYDAAGTLWSLQGPLASRARPDAPAPRDYIALAPEIPCALDGVYSEWEQEYRDIQILTSAEAVPGDR